MYIRSEANRIHFFLSRFDKKIDNNQISFVVYRKGGKAGQKNFNFRYFYLNSLNERATSRKDKRIQEITKK